MTYETGLIICQTIFELLCVAALFAVPAAWKDLKELIRG